jgi:hypothetical protein
MCDDSGFDIPDPPGSLDKATSCWFQCTWLLKHSALRSRIPDGHNRKVAASCDAQRESPPPPDTSRTRIGHAATLSGPPSEGVDLASPRSTRLPTSPEKNALHGTASVHVQNGRGASPSPQETHTNTNIAPPYPPPPPHTHTVMNIPHNHLVRATRCKMQPPPTESCWVPPPPLPPGVHNRALYGPG